MAARFVESEEDGKTTIAPHFAFFRFGKGVDLPFELASNNS